MTGGEYRRRRRRGITWIRTRATPGALRLIERNVKQLIAYTDEVNEYAAQFGFTIRMQVDGWVPVVQGYDVSRVAKRIDAAHMEIARRYW